MLLQPIALSSDKEWYSFIDNDNGFPLSFYANEFYEIKTELPNCHYTQFSSNGWITISFLTFHREKVPKLGEIINCLPDKIKEYFSYNTAYVFSYILGHEIEDNHQRYLQELGPDNYLFKDEWFMNSYKRNRQPIQLDSDFYPNQMAHKWIGKTILIAHPSIISKEKAREFELSVVYPVIENNANIKFVPCYLDFSKKIYIRTNQHKGVSYAFQDENASEFGIVNDNKIINSNGEIAILAGMLITYHRIGGYHGFFKPSVDETIPQLHADTRFRGGTFLFHTEPLGEGNITKCMLNENVHVGITYVFGLIHEINI